MKPYLILLVLSFLTVFGERYVLYRVTPHDVNGLHALNKMHIMDHKYKVDFWKEAHHLGDHGDLMTSHKYSKVLEKMFTRYNITFQITVSDVQSLIMRNEGNSTFNRRLHDDPILDSEPDLDHSRVGRLKKAKYPFGDYASYADMMKYMRTIEFYYPKITKIVRLGNTHEGKPIEGLKVGHPRSDGAQKRAIWIDGNIHAREWASSHTALYVINQLVSGYGKDELITHYVDNLDFIIVPCLNPDGYEYTRSSPMPNVRLWRKNRSPQKCHKSVWGGEKCCQGVDLNRNFKFHWAESGSSKEPCSNIYHGQHVFSEPEAKAVNDYLSSPEMAGRVDAFITFHSYAQLWIYPYSHAEQSYPEDIAQLRKTARRAIDRLQRMYGTEYRMGTGADTLAPASGGSDDWAKSAMNIKYVYLVELRPEMELSNGFILHKKELIPTAVETLEGIKEVFDAVLKQNHIQRDPIQRIPPKLRRKQMFRMLAMANSRRELQRAEKERKSTKALTTTEPTTTTVQTVPTRAKPWLSTKSPITKSTKWKSKHFERFAATTAASTTTTAAAATTPSETREVRESTTSAASTAASRFKFYTNTKPIAFRDPKCRDMRYSCGFWLKSNRDVCTEQETFMKAQCAYTCKFCTASTML